MKSKLAIILLICSIFLSAEAFAKGKKKHRKKRAAIKQEKAFAYLERQQPPIESYEIVSANVEYSFKDDPIDVVIPCHEKDQRILNQCISSIRSYGPNIRRVIVISNCQLTEEAEWFPVEQFPFSQRDILRIIFENDEQKVEEYSSSRQSRTGWMFQQLIKLYACFVIPDISSNILVLDADTVFLNPVHFISPLGGAFLTIATEHHPPYFEHAQRLIPNFKRVANISGIAHHMLFQKPILEDLFNTLESYHKIPTWQAICKSIDLEEIYGSPFSEYEMYFNFALSRTNQVKIRYLRWRDVYSPSEIYACKNSGFDYVSWHNRPVNGSS